jgi:hypothetical protein
MRHGWIDTFTVSMTMSGVTSVLLPNQPRPASCLSQQFQQQRIQRL